MMVPSLAMIQLEPGPEMASQTAGKTASPSLMRRRQRIIMTVVTRRSYLSLSSPDSVSIVPKQCFDFLIVLPDFTYRTSKLSTVGAGKTTLLKQILESKTASKLRMAIIVNDMGGEYKLCKKNTSRECIFSHVILNCK